MCTPIYISVALICCDEGGLACVLCANEAPLGRPAA